MFLQYFDTVGWVFWPVKTVSHITYTVLAGTLNHAQSINQSIHRTKTYKRKLIRECTTVWKGLLRPCARQLWVRVVMTACQRPCSNFLGFCRLFRECSRHLFKSISSGSDGGRIRPLQYVTTESTYQLTT